MPFGLPCDDSTSEHSAGDSVSALIAEMIIDTETAIANCL